jgi:hypothetical protein
MSWFYWTSVQDPMLQHEGIFLHLGHMRINPHANILCLYRVMWWMSPDSVSGWGQGELEACQVTPQRRKVRSVRKDVPQNRGKRTYMKVFGRLVFLCLKLFNFFQVFVGCNTCFVHVPVRRLGISMSRSATNGYKWSTKAQDQGVKNLGFGSIFRSGGGSPIEVRPLRRGMPSFPNVWPLFQTSYTSWLCCHVMPHPRCTWGCRLVREHQFSMSLVAWGFRLVRRQEALTD